MEFNATPYDEYVEVVLKDVPGDLRPEDQLPIGAGCNHGGWVEEFTVGTGRVTDAS